MSESLARILYDSVNSRVAKFIDDSGDSLLAIAGKLRNAAGTIVNPATEDTLATRATEAKLEAVRALLATIDADTSNLDVALSTRATEATLAAVDAVLDTIYARQADGAQRTKLTDGTDNVAVVDINGVKYIAAGKPNVIDANNSSVAQLGVSATFTGTGTDVSQFSSVAITVHSDQDSAIDGMKFEFSTDNTNWDDSYKFNLDASSSQTRRFQFPVTAQYFRVVYVNGGVATTELRIQTILNRENLLTSIHRVENVVKEDRSAQLVKAAIIAQREGATVTDFFPIQADVSGNLKVTTVGTDVPSDPSALVLDFVKNGGSEDLLVDGSVTPVDFELGPTITDEVWSIRELLLTFAADDFSFDGASFGPNPKLTNGISIKVVLNSVVTEVFVVKQNEDFLRLPGRTPLVNNTGPKDVLGAAIAFQGLVLNQSTSDKVRVTVRDNLTSVKFQYLTATLFAVKVI